jgi:Fic family protein
VTSPVKYSDRQFPPREIDWEELIPLLGPAAAAVARYDGVLGAIPNAAVLLSPLTTQEAVLSSRIEGTQASMSEVLQYEAKQSSKQIGSTSREDDIREILNYRSAINEAETLLSKLPLSLRVVREVHKVLMQGVRGQSKDPGNFRKVPNWIGKPGGDIENARFVPIDAVKLPEAMAAWEAYIHEPQPDALVQLAVIHAEFESLHPFLDGNGRLGRIMIPLFLWQEKIIRRPMFYVSAYFEANREEYYERLLAVSRDLDWTGWCKFFLSGVQQQAVNNFHKATAILELYESLKPKVTTLTRSQYSIHALDFIFNVPIFQRTQFIKSADIPESTARRLLNELTEAEIVNVMEEASGSRAALMCFPSLLNIAEGRKLF